MDVILDHRTDLDLETYRRVAWEGVAVRIAPAALERMAAARAAFLALIDGDPEAVVYGVTSGYGQRAHLRFDQEARRRHAAGTPAPAAAGVGEPLPARVVRGIVLARLANFLDGHAAVSPGLAEAVAALLDGRSLPAVPASGNGSAGEIVPLAHLFTALAEHRTLGEKESLALVNGSPCGAALVADAALAAGARLELALDVFALSVEALRAPLDAYDAALDGLWGEPCEAAMLAALRDRLTGGAAQRRPYQAPVSWRILPRVLGQARRALGAAIEAAGRALAAVTDNPVFLLPDERHPGGRVLSNGGYHAAAATAAIDGLARADADLALLADRHTSGLLDARVSGMPEYLVAGPDGGYPGCLGFTAADLAEQARGAARPSLLPGSPGGGFGQNDVASPVFAAWRKAAETGRCLEGALAVLAAIASQALHVTGRPATPALTGLLDAVRADFPPLGAARMPGPDAARLAARFAARVLSGSARVDSPA